MDLELEAKNWMKERQLSSITAAEYQSRACETAIFPKKQAMEYLTLGLTGEAGEIANKVKKFIRDGADKEAFEVKKVEIASEIGDVLWYCANLANDLGFTLSEIAQENYTKLADRKSRGKIGGDGDSR